MKYIYIDESGDFGFSKKSTKAVIVAATFTDSPIEITRWFNKIKRRKIRKKDKTTGSQIKVQASKPIGRGLKLSIILSSSDLWNSSNNSEKIPKVKSLSLFL